MLYGAHGTLKDCMALQVRPLSSFTCFSVSVTLFLSLCLTESLSLSPSHCLSLSDALTVTLSELESRTHYRTHTITINTYTLSLVRTSWTMLKCNMSSDALVFATTCSSWQSSSSISRWLSRPLRSDVW